MMDNKDVSFNVISVTFCLFSSERNSFYLYVFIQFQGLPLFRQMSYSNMGLHALNALHGGFEWVASLSNS